MPDDQIFPNYASLHSESQQSYADCSTMHSMPSAEGEFFKGKREWSKIKDEILGKYLPPYLTKVNKLGNKIILVDAFAGPGKFADGSIGSPIIICETAEKYVPGSYAAIFVNKKLEHHERLQRSISHFISQKSAVALHGTAEKLLTTLSSRLSDQTLFVYLDPFGLSGADFSSLIPLISRSHSSEMLINISVPTIFRLASAVAMANGRGSDPKIIRFQTRLTAALGGDFWRTFMFDQNLTSREKIDAVMNQYRKNLQRYLPIVGSCPVRESTEKSRLKYFVTFASRHVDAALLMNDIMFKAYWNYVWIATTKGTLFESEDWENALPPKYWVSLTDAISQGIPDNGIPRKLLWQNTVINNFMKFHSKDFRKTVKRLVQDKRIGFKDVRGTGKLNDDAVLSRPTGAK